MIRTDANMHPAARVRLAPHGYCGEGLLVHRATANPVFANGKLSSCTSASIASQATSPLSPKKRSTSSRIASGRTVGASLKPAPLATHGLPVSFLLFRLGLTHHKTPCLVICLLRLRPSLPHLSERSSPCSYSCHRMGCASRETFFSLAERPSNVRNLRRIGTKPYFMPTLHGHGCD
ncbi:hypothetical protein BS50DRAFT_402361 [Corynespora cassiicola Philippines]|uniref:Uncharacterized protein n=1 Tax=Corynespora cassiicola Philippines TaxID=1448308 RepID=A0A2T2NKK0_CORCC|nr:hypothetical protein BS50DRAFT_402361 [Corynespora cassiicola Philippines]